MFLRYGEIVGDHDEMVSWGDISSHCSYLEDEMVDHERRQSSLLPSNDNLRR